MVGGSEASTRGAKYNANFENTKGRKKRVWGESDRVQRISLVFDGGDVVSRQKPGEKANTEMGRTQPPPAHLPPFLTWSNVVCGFPPSGN